VRFVLALLALAAAAFTVAGCAATDGRSTALAQVGGATVAFDSIDGPPPQVFERFVEALNAEAQAKAMPIASREGSATYRVRAYLAAQISRGRTSIAWTFDVYEAGQQRALRLTGEEVAGKPGRDAWTVADAQLLRRIAQNGMAGVASLMNGTREADVPLQPAPASRGPAVADAVPDPAAGTAGRTALAYRRE
jgi:hypothetical protein